MFQSSDPDHMLNKTRIIPLISTLLWKWKSIELAKLGTESSAQYLEKNPLPLWGKIPLLRRPQLHRAEKFSSSTPFLPSNWLAVGGVEDGQGARAPPYSSLGKQDRSGGVDGELPAQAGLDGHHSLSKIKIF